MEASGIGGSGPGDLGRRLEAPSARTSEKVIGGLLAACAVISVITTTAIVISLIGPTIGFFGDVSLGEFFSTDWTPTFEPPSFGVLDIVAGTVSVTLWGCLFAIPIGLAAAIYLSEYASRRVRRVVKPILEVLAGIPTVALGFFAATFLIPIIQDVWPGEFLGGADSPFMALAAGLGIGLLIVPIIASISEDAMSAVPQGLREGAYAMGATRARVATRVVFPAALSGIVASIVLAISRAVGETMIVVLAAGSTPNFSLNPVESVQALTSFIATTATGDIAQGSVTYDSIFAAGTVLFLMTLAMNMISIRLVRRYRQVYE
ncbi:phosphate ABC transporter permease subunit PstC [Thermoleophilia bacterium SCSIO 60948]|nr:phosphate ABC transporter permease subunit PstC [Thermoleophilia bacterium SCSIO 60948]